MQADTTELAVEVHLMFLLQIQRPTLYLEGLTSGDKIGIKRFHSSTTI